MDEQHLPLSDEQMSDILDGGADEALLAHVATCPRCSAQVEESRQLDRRLRGTLHRWDCPPPEQLGDYHQGLLEAVEAHAIAEHLAICARCQGEIADLAKFLAAESPDPIEQIAHMSHLSLAGSPPRAVTTIQPRPLTPGRPVRGLIPGFIAEIPGFRVALMVKQGSAGGVSMTGQITAPDSDVWDGAEVRISIDDQPDVTTSVDDVSTFGFEGLPFGLAHMQISAQGQTPISIPGLDLRDHDPQSS